MTKQTELTAEEMNKILKNIEIDQGTKKLLKTLILEKNKFIPDRLVFKNG
ncbi:hypothetical protein M3221_03265 [Domibacillus indicus]|nr:hypothetical protein [Domibacillus indicus]MCM3787435.1 hypothetical protein [Domibacillus indicus]